MNISEGMCQHLARINHNLPQNIVQSNYLHRFFAGLHRRFLGVDLNFSCRQYHWDICHKELGVLCNMRHPSKTRLGPKSREVSFAHNLSLNYPLVLKFCTEHGSRTAVLCSKFQNNRTTDTHDMDEPDFTRLGLEMSFGRISYTAQPPWFYPCIHKH